VTDGHVWAGVVATLSLALTSVACQPGVAPDAELGAVGAHPAPIVGGHSVPDGAWPGVVWLDSGCSGVLVHPEVVLTAGHCAERATTAWFGTELEITLVQESQVALVEPESVELAAEVDRCLPYPDGGIGIGMDIAFCTLATAVADVTCVPPTQGCEARASTDASEATLVGFGFDSPDGGGLGTKRSAVARVEHIGLEVEIGDAAAGTCLGDSSGPALVRVSSPDSESEWRLLAIMSSGYVGECGVGFYTLLSDAVQWIEEEAQRDLTPCFDPAGNWQPTAACRRPALDADGRPMTAAQELSGTCGEPFNAAEADTEPPVVTIASVNPSAIGWRERAIDVEVVASDGAGWGVRRVQVQLLDEARRVLFDQADEISPYQFMGVLRPDAAQVIRATAIDHAGLVASVEASLDNPEQDRGCTLAPWEMLGGPGSRKVSQLVVLGLALHALLLRKRRRRKSIEG
jgi:hypothetical protein